MREEGEIEKDARAALEREPRVNPHQSPIEVTVQGGRAVLEGELPSIVAKRVAVECIRAVPGVAEVTDRLRVRPSERLGDGTIRDKVCGYLMEEPVFKRSTIVCRVARDAESIERQPPEAEGRVEASIADGIVTLRGQVWSLSHRRLAEVLAWWAPGVCNVVNALDIVPPERDNDDEISDAIALVLEKDPVIHAGQLTRRVRDGRVVLRGLVGTEEERRMAEEDVWYVEGVRDVINEVSVYQPPTGREGPQASQPSFE